MTEQEAQHAGGATATTVPAAYRVPSAVGREGDLDAEIARVYGGFERRRRVLLFGNYGKGNLGDEGILAAVLVPLTRAAEVTVVSRAPRTLARQHGVRSVPMMSLRGALELLRCDHVAIGGGGMFGNGMNIVTSMLPVIALVAQMLRKQTVFLATGAYSSSPAWVQRCLRKVAAGSLFVSVRDLESAAVLNHGPATVLVDDPAISLAPAAPTAARAALRAAGVRLDLPLLGVSLKPTLYADRNEAQVTAAAAACAWWRDVIGGECVLLVLSGRGDNGVKVTDQTLLDAVRARTGTAGVHLFGPDLPPELMKAAIGQLRLVVGHRLHAQIYGWSMGVPVIGISYERKSDCFLEAHRLSRLDLWAVAPEPLIELISAAIG
jgi:polysaccharide pyruvyl transferase WcaK-like protein